MSTDLARRHTSNDVPSTEVSEAITQALDGLRAIRTFIKAEFHDKVDFGVIPGCGDKPTLFLPGAQKAMMYFNARPKRHIERIDIGGCHVQFIVTTKIVSRSTGQFLGEGVGCCSTMEEKYRYRKAERVCPSCGVAAIIKGKEEYGGGFLCFKKKGGCGAKFGDQAKAITSQPEGQAEHPNLYDVHNTVLKMAKKRADVDAAMTLGCLSELFTQDIEDTYPMVEVRESARQEEPEPHHIDGEIIEEHPPSQKSAPGLFTKEHVKVTEKFNAWITEQCDVANETWHKFWEPKIDKAFADGMAVPEKIGDVINPWEAKGHLLKWALATGRISAEVKAEATRTRQTDAYVAWVASQSADSKAAVKAEMFRYITDQDRIKSDAIYRKNPDLAPAGWLEEQAEAAEPDRGDAYEPTEQDMHDMHETMGNA